MARTAARTGTDLPWFASLSGVRRIRLIPVVTVLAACGSDGDVESASGSDGHADTSIDTIGVTGTGEDGTAGGNGGTGMTGTNGGTTDGSDGSDTGDATAGETDGEAPAGYRIAAGGDHVCFVTPEGGLKCWGKDEQGQLGNGTADASYAEACSNLSPTCLPGPSAVDITGVAGITAGFAHTCALMDDRGVKCWGNDYYGEIGIGHIDTGDVFAPVDVDITDVVGVSAGSAHTCAVLADGTVKCWGEDRNGELGNGDDDSELVPCRGALCAPLPVDALITEAVSVAAGEGFTCAVRRDQSLHCWGSDGSGQLGNGEDRVSQSSPVPVDIGPVVEVSAGNSHACARTVDGRVECWGGNGSGKIGIDDPDISSVHTPVDVGLSNVVSIAVGGSHTLAGLDGGAAMGWGRDFNGQLGNGATGPDTYYSPVPVDIDEVVELAAGGSHTCAIRSDGGVWCWGSNHDGTVGNDDSTTTTDQHVPTPAFTCTGPLRFAAPEVAEGVAETVGVPAGMVFPADVAGTLELRLAEHGIDELGGLQCLTDLEVLDLDGNHIVHLRSLVGLRNLLELRLASNGGQASPSLFPLEDLRPLSVLTKLQILDLRQNGVADLTPLVGLPNLTSLWITENEIDCADQAANIEALTTTVDRNGGIFEHDCP